MKPARDHVDISMALVVLLLGLIVTMAYAPPPHGTPGAVNDAFHTVFGVCMGLLARRQNG